MSEIGGSHASASEWEARTGTADAAGGSSRRSRWSRLRSFAAAVKVVVKVFAER